MKSARRSEVLSKVCIRPFRGNQRGCKRIKLESTKDPSKRPQHRNTCHALHNKKEGRPHAAPLSLNVLDYLSERRLTKISSHPITPESIPVKSAETLAKFVAVIVSDATESPFTLSVDLLPLRSTTISK